MSAINIVVDKEFLEEIDAVDRFISRIENCGNDRIELIIPKKVVISKNVIDLLIYLHLTDVNKSIRILYKDLNLELVCRRKVDGII